VIGSIGTRNKKAIAVHSSLSAGTVRSSITVSRDLEKYFKHCTFFSSYDTEIVADNSILDIPVLSVVLPLAWVTGADVYVHELDRTFAESIVALQREYEKMYLPFTTRLVADKLVDNKYLSNNTALLFSGGLDCTYTLFSNMTLKPRLIMILGTYDIPISNVTFLKAVEGEYSGFAEREGLTISFIRTNALQILDRERVDHLFGSMCRTKSLDEGEYWPDDWPDYWTGIGYALCHIGQSAPLSIRRFSQLLVAGGALLPIDDEAKTRELRIREAQTRGKVQFRDASNPTKEIAWANIRVKHDTSIRSRHEKASLMKEFLNAHKVTLRVCLECAHNRPPQSPPLKHLLNCSHCPKCSRTIAPLALAGIDPNECGFCVDESTFDYIRASLPHHVRSDIAVWWKPLQRAIPEEIETDRYGTRRFFEWLKSVDLESIAKPDRNPLWNLYYRLPYPIAHASKIVWNRASKRSIISYFHHGIPCGRKRSCC
jgi:hypothetical protein